MQMTKFGRLNLLALLALSLIVVALAACGDSEEAPQDVPTATDAGAMTPTASPTATPSVPVPTAAPTATTAPTSAAGAPVLDVDINADTTWQEMFDALTAPEQNCIHGALGDELGHTLTLPLSDPPEEVAESIFSCLEVETARAVFVSTLVGSFEQEFGALGEEEKSCFGEVVSDIDVAALMAAPDDSSEGEETLGRVFSCIPYVVVAFANLMSPADLSQEERACIREVTSGTDLSAILVAAGLSGSLDDSASAEEIAATFARVNPCFLDSSARLGTPLTVADYAEWCSDTQHMGHISVDDGITYGAFAEEIEDALAVAKATSPPDEVMDFHVKHLLLLRALAVILQEQTQGNAVDPVILSSVVLQVGLVDEASNNLADNVRERLLAAGCTASEAAAQAPTAVPTPTAVTTAAPEEPTPTPTATADGALAGDTLQQIRDQGWVGCGSLHQISEMYGFALDLCAAVAAAVLGDPGAFRIWLMTPSEVEEAFQSGEVDMMVTLPHWATSDDVFGGNFVHPVFYDELVFLAPEQYGLDSALGLDGAAACVHSTGAASHVADFAERNDLNIGTLIFDDIETVLAAYLGGQCDAAAANRLQLATLTASGFFNPSGHVILSGVISETAFGPVVPDGDSQWADVVKAVMTVLIYAEAYGVDSSNVPHEATGDVGIDRLFGLAASTWLADLGLSETAAQDVVRQVGNYAEIYTRHLGSDALDLARENSANALWSGASCRDCPKGGQIYAEPLW